MAKERYKFIITITDRPDVGEDIVQFYSQVYDRTNTLLPEIGEVEATAAAALHKTLTLAAKLFLEKINPTLN